MGSMYVCMHSCMCVCTGIVCMFVSVCLCTVSVFAVILEKSAETLMKK